MNKKEILKGLGKKWNTKDMFINLNEYTQLTNDIQQIYDTEIYIEMTSNDSDYWGQVTFYSKKLGLSIVIDNDFEADTVEEFIEKFLEVEKEAKELEARITLK